MRYLAVIFLFISITDVYASERGKYFSGKTLPGFGLQVSYTIENGMAVDIMRSAKTQKVHIWLESTEKPKPNYFFIEDEIIIELGKHQSVVGQYGCKVGGMRKKNIVAISNSLPEDLAENTHHTVFSEAWTVDFQTKRFQKISVNGLICIQPHWGNTN